MLVLVISLLVIVLWTLIINIRIMNNNLTGSVLEVPSNVNRLTTGCMIGIYTC